MKALRGLSLVELVVSLLLMAMMAGIITTIYRSVQLGMSQEDRRSAADILMDRGLESMSRDLRQAAAVLADQGRHEIRFTALDSNAYIYYLYNPSNTYPVAAFDQPSYELRRSQLTGGLSGNFVYGAGALVLRDVLPPPQTDLVWDGQRMILDLRVTKGNETVHSRTAVRPRNV